MPVYLVTARKKQRGSCSASDYADQSIGTVDYPACRALASQTPGRIQKVDPP